MGYEKPEKPRNIQNVNKNIMLKLDIHPKWFPNAPVYSNGKPICYVESTKNELQIDVWLGNHPFYNDALTVVDTEGRVEKFMKKYGLN